MSSLTRTDTIASGDLVVLYKTSQGDYRGLSAANLLTYLNANLSVSAGFGAYTTQYAAPSSTGFTVTITDEADDNTNVHLILTPTGTLAAGTIKLPAVSGCIDKQEVLVNSTQEITTLTIDGNGATAVTGEPASLSANGFFRLKLDLATSTWYRVG